LAASVAAAATQGQVVLVDGADLRQEPTASSLTATAGLPAVLVGGLSEDAAWQLEVVREGRTLPGGGFLMFPGRRLVAFYGNPLTPNLGVLGHQGPEETVDRLLPIAEEYRTEDVEILPTFEIIATVASAVAGTDGDYSEETAIEDMRPWVEVARERGLYVLLDLQPGRTDFLTQARMYEELLSEPHVGLALDPEWRLGPNQVHLRQIGTVSAAEVNSVAEWLAELVRRERLPQKLFLLHQFKLTMIQDRSEIIAPSELAVVIQMDGQGPLPTKYSTWNALTVGTESEPWRWGWKNFYALDTPLASPDEVLALDPVPVVVSYQ
jgi:hypothetical protein